MTYAYQLLLALVLATSVGTAAAAQGKTDSSATAVIDSTPAQDAARASTDKMSADKTANAGQRHHATKMRHSHKMARRESVPPEEKTYRAALRQCVKDQDQSQRDSCLDSAIELHDANG